VSCDILLLSLCLESALNSCITSVAPFNALRAFVFCTTRAFPEINTSNFARSMIGWNSERNVLRKRSHGPRTVLPRSASFPAGGTSDFQNKQKGARMWLKVLRQNITHLARRAKGEKVRARGVCVCVCMCVREREKERERVRKRVRFCYSE